MSSQRDTFVAWLRDAYAMEKQAIDLLHAQLDRLRHYPEMQGRLREHLEETRGQVAVLERCLKRYNAEPSTFKEAATRFVGMVQSLTTSMADDEVVKDALATSTFEAFEIASYRCNIAAAEILGDQETRRDLEGILAQEQRMQAWMEEQLPVVARLYLQREASHPATASR